MRCFLALIALLQVLLNPTGRSLLAQGIPYDPQIILLNYVEGLAAFDHEEYNPDELIQDLVLLIENPVSINTASYADLERIFFLNHFQIISVLDYIDQYGPIYTIYELSFVLGFDTRLAQELVPFIQILPYGHSGDHRPLFQYGRHDLFFRTRTLVETPIGYSQPPDDNTNATRYMGSKAGLYTRYSYRTPSGLQAGFVGEKDPGEEFLSGSNPYGFDHTSMHIQMDGIGRVETIVIGDYNADFGQGLTVWTGSSFGKGTDPLGVRKRPKGLYRFASTEENRYLRGAGSTVRFGPVGVSVFGSHKYIDAVTTDTLINGSRVYTSLPSSGLHRTPSEVARRNQIAETVVGGNASINKGRARGGATICLVNIDGQREIPSQPYRFFEPELSSRVNLGADFSYAYMNHLLFSELAHTVGHGVGVLGGGLFRLHQQFNLSVLGRRYSKDYSVYYVKPFAETASVAGESGIFVGFEFFPFAGWEVKGYSDFFQYNWLRYGVNTPSRGNDYMLEASWLPTQRHAFALRYRKKEQEGNWLVEESHVRWVLPTTRRSVRGQVDIKPGQLIELRTRAEYVWYLQPNLVAEHGIMVFQDIRCRFNSIPLVITGRFAVFDTDSWGTRVYAYEHDVLYSFSVPAYYSQGTRAYMLAKYSIGRSVDLWARVSQSYFFNQTSIGTGLDRIDAPTRTEVKLQVRVKL